MDEELKSRLAESAGKLLQWAEATSKDADALLREQAPLLAQEIVAFKWCSSLIVVVVSFAVAALCAVGAIPSVRKGIRGTGSEADEVIFFCGSVGCASACVALAISSYHFLLAHFAPRLVILRELQNLL